MKETTKSKEILVKRKRRLLLLNILRLVSLPRMRRKTMMICILFSSTASTVMTMVIMMLMKKGEEEGRVRLLFMIFHDQRWEKRISRKIRRKIRPWKFYGMNINYHDMFHEENPPSYNFLLLTCPVIKGSRSDCTGRWDNECMRDEDALERDEHHDDDADFEVSLLK